MTEPRNVGRLAPKPTKSHLNYKFRGNSPTPRLNATSVQGFRAVKTGGARIVLKIPLVNRNAFGLVSQRPVRLHNGTKVPNFYSCEERLFDFVFEKSTDLAIFVANFPSIGSKVAQPNDFPRTPNLTITRH